MAAAIIGVWLSKWCACWRCRVTGVAALAGEHRQGTVAAVVVAEFLGQDPGESSQHVGQVVAGEHGAEQDVVSLVVAFERGLEQRDHVEVASPRPSWSSVMVMILSG